MAHIPEESPESYEQVFLAACAAGTKAAAAVTPPLMLVMDLARITETAEDGGGAPALWFGTDGPAGMGTVFLRPANCRFARWLLKQGLGSRSDDRPGISLSADCGSQSIHKAAAYALAFALVIGKAGFGVETEIVLIYD